MTHFKVPYLTQGTKCVSLIHLLLSLIILMNEFYKHCPIATDTLLISSDSPLKIDFMTL